jgi:hypothetical protein
MQKPTVNAIFISAVARYSEWGAFGSCDQDCKGGVKTRNRTCTDVTGADRGSDCGTDLQEKIECENLPDCVGGYPSQI